MESLTETRTQKNLTKHLKVISSPVEIRKCYKKRRESINNSLRGKTGIPSYIVRNYTIKSGDQKVLIDELKPGRKRHSRSAKRAKNLEFTGRQALKYCISISENNQHIKTIIYEPFTTIIHFYLICNFISWTSPF